MEFLTDGLTFKDAKRSALVYGIGGVVLGLFMSSSSAK